jgi:hypothetical protein
MSDSMTATTHTAYFDRFTFDMPSQAVKDCSHQGSCDDEVEYWESIIDLSHIPASHIRAELKEYGAWSYGELANDDDNRKRIIWIAAGNIKEELTSKDD